MIAVSNFLCAARMDDSSHVYGGIQRDAILVAYRVLEDNLRVHFLRERYFGRENLHAQAMARVGLSSFRGSRICRSYPFALCTSVSRFTVAELRVWDAKTMASEPVARVKLPAKVPMGFHAIFVSEEELASQH